MFCSDYCFLKERTVCIINVGDVMKSRLDLFNELFKILQESKKSKAILQIKMSNNLYRF